MASGPREAGRRAVAVRLLSDGFRVISAAARSAERRAGLEWLVVAERD